MMAVVIVVITKSMPMTSLCSSCKMINDNLMIMSKIVDLKYALIME